MVVPAAIAPRAVHRRLHMAGHRGVERIGGLAGLEEGVGVMRRATHERPFGGERPGAMGVYQVVVDHGADLFVLEQEERVHFVAGAEAVEEMQERHARGERRDLRHQREIVRLLHRTRGQHGENRCRARP